jgi:hypothetical protein
MAADVWLENKSSFRCDVIATQAEILVDNKHLGTLSLLEPTRLEAHSSQQWPCKLEIRAQDLFSSLPSGLELLIGDKKIPTQVRGTVIARIFLFKRSFGFDVRQDLDAKMLGSMF